MKTLQMDPSKGTPVYSVHVLCSHRRKLSNEPGMEINSFIPKLNFPSFSAFCGVFLADIPVSTWGSINQKSNAIKIVKILETVYPTMNAQL